jgi:hypothetical protein
MLLKMTFIFEPYIKTFSACQSSKFFYMPPEPLYPILLSGAWFAPSKAKLMKYPPALALT